mmetsp:Transcript_23589/g.44837  ORF Transcript_23589/g.44837 Transcript_23589/m.44837 type:complete len:81 (+) Transcript_23589:109-351(+)
MISLVAHVKSETEAASIPALVLASRTPLPCESKKAKPEMLLVGKNWACDTDSTAVRAVAGADDDHGKIDGAHENIECPSS